MLRECGCVRVSIFPARNCDEAEVKNRVLIWLCIEISRDSIHLPTLPTILSNYSNAFNLNALEMQMFYIVEAATRLV